MIDVSHYRPVATYGRLSTWLEQGGRVWYVEDPVGTGTSTLTSAIVPSQTIRDQWSKVPTDETQLVIHPGVEVALELQTNDAHTAETRQSLVQSLSQRGLKIVPQSPIKLVGTIGPGKTSAMNYTSVGRFGRNSTAVSVQGHVATLSYQVDGNTVWEHTRETSAPHFMHLKKGESIAETAQSQANLDSQAFLGFWIPVNVPRPNPDVTAATSEYPAN